MAPEIVLEEDDPELAPHTVPAYVPGSDPVRSRADIESVFV